MLPDTLASFLFDPHPLYSTAGGVNKPEMVVTLWVGLSGNLSGNKRKFKYTARSINSIYVNIIKIFFLRSGADALTQTLRSLRSW